LVEWEYAKKFPSEFLQFVGKGQAAEGVIQKTWLQTRLDCDTKVVVDVSPAKEQVLENVPSAEEKLIAKLKRKLHLKKKEIYGLSTEKDGLLVQLQKELHGKERIEQKMSTLTKKLEEAVVCCVCLAVPRDDKIPVCINGHITCSECKKKTGKSCPSCRVVTKARDERYSILARGISDLLELGCVNEAKGCREKQLKPEIIKHEQECVYAEIHDCPYNCVNKVSYYCIEHLQNVHLLRFSQLDFGVWFSGYLGPPITFSFIDNPGITLAVQLGNTSDHTMLIQSRKSSEILLAIKCISKDRYKRYKYEMKLKLVEGEMVGGVGANLEHSYSGETLLMTEEVDSVSSGMRLALTGKSMRPYNIMYGIPLFDLKFKVEEINPLEESESRSLERTNSEENEPKPSGSGLKRPHGSSDETPKKRIK